MNRIYHLTGIIQGVGFRPYVYQLAYRYTLSGYVCNTNRGVTIEVEGEEKKIEEFAAALQNEPPPLARIDTLEVVEQATVAHTSFEILQSSHDESSSALVSPDIALCQNCLEEMQDSSNRRFGYALTNCTDCGPRYSIINTLPYDRPNTTMNDFVMCSSCKREYGDPMDRRYHAQPISCPECGPAGYRDRAVPGCGALSATGRPSPNTPG